MPNTGVFRVNVILRGAKSQPFLPYGYFEGRRLREPRLLLSAVSDCREAAQLYVADSKETLSGIDVNRFSLLRCLITLHGFSEPLADSDIITEQLGQTDG